MAGTQQVPAGMSAEDADNFEEVRNCQCSTCCRAVPLHFTCQMLTGRFLKDREAVRREGYVPSATKPNIIQCVCSSPNTKSVAVKHLETYWAILEKVKGSTLRLTKIDNDIYDHLVKDFPDFDPAKPIIEDEMKSPEGKKRWREFMMAYEDKVDDYSFGTILRTDPKDEYTQHGSIFGECFILGVLFSGSACLLRTSAAISMLTLIRH